MQKYQNNVLDRSGNAVAGLTVTVTLQAGGGLATIYSDNAGSVAPNPLTTDANGYFEFYAADGRYNIDAPGGGYHDVLIADTVLIAGAAAASASAAQAAATQTAADKLAAETAASLAVPAATTATTKAAEAASSASTALTQAGNATTQAGNALASATSAATSADIALARGRTYPTPAAGVNPAGTPAGVAAGEYFTVPSSTVGYALDLYLNSAGTAVLQNGKSILATDAAMYYRGTTEVGEVVTNNFNLLIKPGWYWNARASACLNTPYGTAVAPGAIHVARIGPDLGRRTFYKDGLLAEQHVCTFTFSTGAIVSAWKRVLGDGQLFASLFNQTSKYRGSFDSAATDPAWGLNYSSFNSATLPGFYWNPKSSAVLMSPYGTAVAQGGIVNEPMGPDLMLQTWYKSSANPQDEVWSRPCTPSLLPDPSAWGTWSAQTSLTTKIPAARLADNFPFREEVTARPVNTDRDFNKCLLPGVYTFNGSQAVLNSPLGSGAIAGLTGTLTVSFRRALIEQAFRFNDNPNDVAKRTFDSTPTFSTWVRKTKRNGGRLLCTLGDSITAGVGASVTSLGYAPLMARFLGLALTNKGFGGASLAYRSAVSSTINDNSFARITAGATMAGFNVITVAYGTNDWGNNVPIGLPGSTNEQEVYGALAQGYDQIMAVNPGARVIFITPIYRHPETATNSILGLTLQAYRDAIVAFCVSRNLTCIQPHKLLGWNAGNQATFLGDTLHPNDVGHDAIARCDAGQVESVV